MTVTAVTITSIWKVGEKEKELYQHFKSHTDKYKGPGYTEWQALKHTYRQIQTKNPHTLSNQWCKSHTKTDKDPDTLCTLSDQVCKSHTDKDIQRTRIHWVHWVTSTVSHMQTKTDKDRDTQTTLYAYFRCLLFCTSAFPYLQSDQFVHHWNKMIYNRKDDINSFFLLL